MDSNGIFENAGGMMALGIVLIGLWIVIGRSMGLMSGIVLVVMLCTVFTHDPLAQLTLRFILNIIVPFVIIFGLFRMALGGGIPSSRK